MKTLKVLFFSFILLSTYVSADISGNAPDFELSGTLAGKTEKVKLSNYRGHVIYLDFWASWCSPCKNSFPWMNEMQAKYKDKGVTFIAINVDRKQKDAKAFLVKTPAEFLIAFDSKGKTPDQYDVMGMPSAFVIDKDGTILHSHIGFHKNDLAEYEAHIQQALTN